MRTAISLPDELHQAADAFARRSGRTRSQLYADALRDYLSRHDEDAITVRMDEVCAAVTGRMADDPSRAAKRRLLAQEW
ncbi:MAG: hypothetical protein GXP55_03330 [Deltaproteobacteria bacterium]|nr:hypothetical protein [Deltaproteobacteria bacterium]